MGRGVDGVVVEVDGQGITVKEGKNGPRSIPPPIPSLHGRHCAAQPPHLLPEPAGASSIEGLLSRWVIPQSPHPPLHGCRRLGKWRQGAMAEEVEINVPSPWMQQVRRREEREDRFLEGPLHHPLSRGHQGRPWQAQIHPQDPLMIREEDSAKNFENKKRPPLNWSVPLFRREEDSAKNFENKKRPPLNCNNIQNNATHVDEALNVPMQRRWWVRRKRRLTRPRPTPVQSAAMRKRRKLIIQSKCSKLQGRLTRPRPTPVQSAAMRKRRKLIIQSKCSKLQANASSPMVAFPQEREDKVLDP